MLQDLFRNFVSFEAQAQHFNILALLGVGLLLLIAGLVVWLGGIAFSRVISAIIAGLVAFLGAIALTGGAVSASILACATGLVVGAVLQRPVFAIGAAILVSSCVFALASTTTGQPMTVSLSTPSSDAPALTVKQSLQRTRTFAGDLRHNFIAISDKQPFQIYVLAIGAGLAAFIATIYFRNFGAAFGCSALGTLMSLGGMMMLLFFKGAQPVEFISDHAVLVAAIFASMIIFGIVIQMLLMRPRKAKKVVVQAPSKRMEEAEPTRPPRLTTISLRPTRN